MLLKTREDCPADSSKRYTVDSDELGFRENKSSSGIGLYFSHGASLYVCSAPCLGTTAARLSDCKNSSSTILLRGGSAALQISTQRFSTVNASSFNTL